jgi:hypothetical protein
MQLCYTTLNALMQLCNVTGVVVVVVVVAAFKLARRD